MGLLTDPNSSMLSGPLFTSLLKHQNVVCIALYLAGVVWFASLAYKPFNAGTYFSENALLPGLVEGSFNAEKLATQLHEELLREAEAYDNSLPYPWIQAKLRQFGLNVYTHNFTLHYPFGGMGNYTGKNIYGILRARRGDNTEAIVLTTPYRPPYHTVLEKTTASVALMLALAKHFREQPYWAKDIIFLISEHEQLGVAAWLEAYHKHTRGHGVLDAGVLSARAGQIQAAVNIELSSIPVSHVDIRIEGLNGQLPNLDLVNLAHRLCGRERVRHTFKQRVDHLEPDSVPGYIYSLTTLLHMVSSQATGVSSGNHGLFHQWGIQAVTLHGGMDQQYPWGRAGFHQLGRILEGMLRSLNNLLERFHQSFFFYLQSATNRYISIGLYMPPFGLIGGVLALKAACLWIETLNKVEERDKNKDTEDKNDVDYSLLSMTSIYIVHHMAGCLILASPQYLSQLGALLLMSADQAIYYGFLCISIIMLFTPFIINRSLSVIYSRETLKCVSCLQLGLILFSVAMYNISLALVIASLYVPICSFISTTKSTLVNAFQALLLVVIHPLSLVLIFTLLDTCRAFPDEGVSEIAGRALSANIRAVMYSITDNYIYGNWVYPVTCVALLPTWHLFWNVLHSK